MESQATIPIIAAVFLLVLLGTGGMVAASKKPEFLGHPKGLYMLFFAEMWERFSFYGMRALLIFYLTKHWLFDDSKSNLIYGSYLSLVYITPVLGGYLADRYLGQRRAVFFGGILLMLGHFLMAVEGSGGQSDPAINVFWAALAFIIVGSGLRDAAIIAPPARKAPSRTTAMAAIQSPSFQRAMSFMRNRPRIGVFDRLCRAKRAT